MPGETINDFVVRSAREGAGTDAIWSKARRRFPRRLVRRSYVVSILKKNGVGTETRDYWKLWEDKIVRDNVPSVAAKLLPHRTLGACNKRRALMLHPDNFDPEKHSRENRWTPAERKLLERLWPVLRISELENHFPRFSRDQIRGKAGALRLRKKYVGHRKVMLRGMNELIDQILIRAKEDGFHITKMDKLFRTGVYFANGNYRRYKSPRLDIVAKAVEFFGGKLVIDWCDR